MSIKIGLFAMHVDGNFKRLIFFANYDTYEIILLLTPLITNESSQTSYHTSMLSVLPILCALNHYYLYIYMDSQTPASFSQS